MKLMDLEKVHEVDISGTIVKMRAMNWQDNISLASATEAIITASQAEDDKTDVAVLLCKAKPDIDPILEAHIVEIDDVDGSVLDVLNRVTVGDYMGIVTSLFTISKLAEDEVKN